MPSTRARGRLKHSLYPRDMGGGPGKDHELAMNSLREDVEPRRWDRGTWIRFGLALTPLIVILLIGLLFLH
jgi:hypothetical protein